MVSFKAGDHQVVPPQNGWFPKMRIVYNGTSFCGGYFGGTPILGSPPKLVVSDPKTMISWGFHHQL